MKWFIIRSQEVVDASECVPQISFQVQKDGLVKFSAVDQKGRLTEKTVSRRDARALWQSHQRVGWKRVP